MTTARCPNCGERPTPIAYGLPGPDLIDAAQRGRVVLGGCVIGDDDPVAACRRCGVGLWGHGVFTVDGNLRARLGVPSRRIEAMLTEEGALWLSDDDQVAVVPPADVDVVALIAVHNLFDDAAALRRWLGRRRLTYTGNASGRLVRVAVRHDRTLAVWAEDGVVELVDELDRLALHLLRDLVRSLHMRSVDELVGFLEVEGVSVVRSVVPAG